jgi:hypothetical protein
MDQIHTRDYYKIFTGSNKENGSENIFLTYEAEVSELVFPADQTTYFHFPFYSQSTPIQTSGLIEAGAIGGLNPYNSDRVFKKQANYEQTSSWGNSLNKRDGEWACSWLYLSAVDAKPVWMDRYFLPGQATYQDALTINLQSRFKYTTHIPAIYDIPSQLTFDPGVWYSFYHIGKNKIG